MSGSRKLTKDIYTFQDHEIKLLIATGRPYWEKFRNFWESVMDKPVIFLSSAQTNWLDDVERELEDKWRPQWMEELGTEL